MLNPQHLYHHFLYTLIVLYFKSFIANGPDYVIFILDSLDLKSLRHSLSFNIYLSFVTSPTVHEAPSGLGAITIDSHTSIQSNLDFGLIWKHRR